MLKLKENNKKVIKKVLLESAEIKSDRELYKRVMGFDPLIEAEKFPVMESNFS